MTNPDSVEDILYYAISREIEANVFYNLLSQYVDNAQVRLICDDLASEELEHKARLELELIKLGRTVKQTAAARQSNKMVSRPLDYMLSMVKVMQMGLPELLLFAMAKEKISFRFYIDLLAAVHDEQSRQTILEIAEEEARHKMRFEIEYDKLMAIQQKPPALM